MVVEFSGNLHNEQIAVLASSNFMVMSSFVVTRSSRILSVYADIIQLFPGK